LAVAGSVVHAYDGAMSKVINLNTARKQKARTEKRADGDVNAAKFGRTKADHALTRTREDKAARDHAQHKRDE